jgi:hypothetical protein
VVDSRISRMIAGVPGTSVTIITARSDLSTLRVWNMDLPRDERPPLSRSGAEGAKPGDECDLGCCGQIARVG